MPKTIKHKALARGPWWTVRQPATADGAAPDSTEVLIYGDIGKDWWSGEGVDAAELVKQIGEIATPRIVARINSYGGSVADGLAIYNALRRHPAEIEVDVDGVAVSIASLIAMAGDTVRMAANTRLMIHAPWGGCMGNANDMREMADMLDGYAESMAGAYVGKSGQSIDSIMALLGDGKDHWYSATQALEAGFCDEVLENSATPAEKPAARFAALAKRFAPPGLDALLAGGPMTTPTLAAWRAPLSPEKPAAPTPISQPAASAASPQEVSPMNWKTLAAAMGISLASGLTDAEARAALCKELKLQDSATDDAISAALAQRNTGKLSQDELRSRNAGVRQAFAAHRAKPGVADLEAEILADPGLTIDQARARLLDKLGEGAEPLAAGLPRVEGGADASDKRMSAMVNATLARAGIRKDPESGKAIAYDGSNPYRGLTLRELARASLRAGGRNPDGMDALEVARAALVRAAGGQSTSDFPVFLENTLHKMVLTGFLAAPSVYQRFCKIGSVSDLRAWNRIVPGMIANLDPVSEGGEYKNKNLPDGEKEPVQARRRGNIIEITPEVVINDDLGAITDTARGLGAAGPRTMDRLVFALLAQNGNLGPVLTKDSKTLFHADHGNTNTGAISVALLGTMSEKMKLQTLPGADAEYLDLGPTIAVARPTVAGDITVVNDSQYDHDGTKLQKPNKSRGMLTDVVGTARMPATIFYLFADPNVAPVIEAVFLDGIQQVRVVQEENFRTGGLAWRGELNAGVGAIDYRGAQYSTGA
jgi:ATP-dependent protease ClpP protease subunit